MEIEFDKDLSTLCSVCDDVEEPPLYRVVLFNDDYTTIEFVMEILKNVFRKNDAEAATLVESAHKNGTALVGIYTYDIAATRVSIAIRNARANGFPLRCELEMA